MRKAHKTYLIIAIPALALLFLGGCGDGSVVNEATKAYVDSELRNISNRLSNELAPLKTKVDSFTEQLEPMKVEIKGIAGLGSNVEQINLVVEENKRLTIRLNALEEQLAKMSSRQSDIQSMIK